MHKYAFALAATVLAAAVATSSAHAQGPWGSYRGGFGGDWNAHYKQTFGWSHACHLSGPGCQAFYFPSRGGWFYWYEPFGRFLPVELIGRFIPPAGAPSVAFADFQLANVTIAAPAFPAGGVALPAPVAGAAGPPVAGAVVPPVAGAAPVAGAVIPPVAGAAAPVKAGVIAPVTPAVPPVNPAVAPAVSGAAVAPAAAAVLPKVK